MRISLSWLPLLALSVVVSCQGAQRVTPTKPTAALTIESPTAVPAIDTSDDEVVITALPEPTATPIESIPTETPLSPTATPVEDVATMTSASVEAANADVTYVRAAQAVDGSWTFYVTVSHPDTGWEDYADGWDVVLPDGTVIKPDSSSPFTRILLHPHENEQPFTRSQGGVVIPADTTEVRVRAHDIVDGFGGREVVVDLTASSGPDFEVER